MTDSWRVVVIRSRYSICSWKVCLLLESPDAAELSVACAERETSEFFAMISSDTWFIRASSFSISTRTVRAVTGLFTVCFFPFASFFAGALFAAGAGAAGFASAAGAAAASAGAGAGAASILNISGVTLSQSTDSISDTFSAAFFIGSSSPAAPMINENAMSNFSSSTSCELGE